VVLASRVHGLRPSASCRREKNAAGPRHHGKAARLDAGHRSHTLEQLVGEGLRRLNRSRSAGIDANSPAGTKTCGGWSSSVTPTNPGGVTPTIVHSRPLTMMV